MDPLDILSRIVLKQVIGIVIDTNVNKATRERAAILATQMVKSLSKVSIADISDLFRAAEAALDVGPIAARWLGTVALSRTPNRAKVIPEIERLAGIACLKSHWPALYSLLALLMRERASFDPLWIEMAIRSALAGLVRAIPAAMLASWLEAGGTLTPGLADLIQEGHRRLLNSEWLSLPSIMLIHPVQPTPTGWTVLAELTGIDDACPIQRFQFGNHIQVAHRSLLEALEEAEVATRLKLARWMVELFGNN